MAEAKPILIDSVSRMPCTYRQGFIPAASTRRGSFSDALQRSGQPGNSCPSPDSIRKAALSEKHNKFAGRVANAEMPGKEDSNFDDYRKEKKRFCRILRYAIDKLRIV